MIKTTFGVFVSALLSSPEALTEKTPTLTTKASKQGYPSCNILLFLFVFEIQPLSTGNPTADTFPPALTGSLVLIEAPSITNPAPVIFFT
jgi:hypothetical protein